jgi:transcription elongation GreA/GreB family factor
VNKPELVKRIIAQLTEIMSHHLGAARAAHAEATDEETKAEDKYDTRGLEASYLAAGQARQMEETASALREFAAMFLPKFGPADAIDLGALVELETKKDRSLYFIGPSAGGTEVDHEKKTVLVITPQSPLGQQLVGRKQGERLKIKIGGAQNEYRVLSVS